MNVKKVLLGGLAGGIAAFLAGWVIYGVILMDFMAAHKGSATGVDKAEMDLFHVFLGNLCLGLLLAYIYDRWAGINTFVSGAKAGATIGVLMCASFNLQFLGMTNIMTFAGAAVDVIGYTLLAAITGGAVGFVLGKLGEKA